MRSLLLLSIVVAACGDLKVATLPTPTTAPPEPTEPALTPPSDPDTGPQDRPPPEPTIRTCAVRGEASREVDYFYNASTTRVRLGNPRLAAALVQDVLWATGTPEGEATPETGRLTIDADDVDSLGPALGRRGLYSTAPATPGGHTALDVYLYATKPTATQLTRTIVSRAYTERYVLKPLLRTAKTPTQPGRFVSALQGTRAFAVTLMVRTSSPCASGALSDALQKDATVTDILAPANREAMQTLLERDGSSIAIGAYSSRRLASLEKVLFDSACSAQDLDACQKLLDDVAALALAEPTPPSYARLAANDDPEWAFLDYETESTALLPKPGP